TAEQSPQEPADDRLAALARAAAEVSQAPGATAPPSNAAGPFRLLDISLGVMGAAGASTAPNSVLGTLQGGSHDAKRRGFTLQQAEIAVKGAIDPYLTGNMIVVTLLDPDTGETIVELEEAYVVTQQLPAGLQVKAGTYYTDFGRTNSRHPHQWDWMSQPVINTRLFGADGMRGPGARVAWLLPTEHYAELYFGVQNANGETMPSFLANEEVYDERAIGGRAFTMREVRGAGELAYTARVATSFDVTASTSIAFGASAAFGPNATGADGETLIYGGDFVAKWRPEGAQRGYPFLKFEAEFLGRAFDAATQTDDSDPMNPVTLPGDTLEDRGGFASVVWGFAQGWATGLRGEYATGRGASYLADSQSFDRSMDPFRTDRLRITSMLAYKPSEFSRIRLEYGYDDSDHLRDPEHSVWLGFEFLIGNHPPHVY
ncbi:MAG: hypothetical protein KDE27_05060, partial [Planctomycetes bacterium]|nr:hypothetical protein [Planctomycetota bacterium]